jgi:2-oxoglutarate dehydrogenase complex dehydrogenase (E1) component-like enzyme
MYEKIRAMKSSGTLYAEQLIKQGITKEASVLKTIEKVASYFEEEFKASESEKPSLKNTTDPNY